MTAITYSVTDAVGLPECALPRGLLSRLPATVAPAPWDVRCEVVSWMHEIDDDLHELIPEVIRPTRVVLVAWALVHYAETPVGPYSELAATLIGEDGVGHIPFIVVDSLASVVGGRVNWLLPKAVAEFTATAGGRHVVVKPLHPPTPAWIVEVDVEPGDGHEALTMSNTTKQAGADGSAGTFAGEMSGNLSGARIRVVANADGPLGRLLRSGEFEGSLLSQARFCVSSLNR